MIEYAYKLENPGSTWTYASRVYLVFLLWLNTHPDRNRASEIDRNVQIVGGVIMNKKLLIGIIVVIIVFVILPMVFPMILGEPPEGEEVNIWGILGSLVSWLTFLIPLVIWIYLIIKVRRKKIKLAERRYKRLKKFLMAGGISLVVGIIGLIGHNAIYALSEIEESIFFFIGLVGFWVFFIATIGGLVILLRGRRKAT